MGDKFTVSFLIYDMTTVIIILIVVILIYSCGIIWAMRRERKYWNGGTCPDCGKPLRKYETSAGGIDLWKCDGCGYETMVSYPRFVYSKKK